MRKTFAAVATTLAVAITPIVTSAPAHADTPGCVTKSEFRAVKNGWSTVRVHNRFDTSGRLVSQSGAYRSREYRPCRHPRYSYISVSYDHGRVDYKSAYFG
ncbi:MAG: hypothetical protein WKF82_00165 [Nocardioidaceae bacterium]